ncbi:sporulation protein [Bacillus sonorensis]|uniref:sporulation protein n=1 Tax=Bacillus sonorensis TaxID=119858 RepID=UPI00227F65F2|nr:sporulation protein [Bacillus sonorensis]MCY7855438.1 sporulation protein [Bacillus sonorensis]MCY8271163.1 sporulation protein [Bacillus sonorensis]MCY8606276.1 sporulation protein [Bacillus sonorensis]MEC1501925.1 sporulation protein [Bacillus sonorensis]
MKKTSGSLPFFHDLSQENLFLKAELARCHQLIHELEASYFHQKNQKLHQENASIKQELQQLTLKLQRVSENNQDGADETLNRIKSELLEKIVVLQELLQNETFKRKQEIEEKHRLHVTNVKASEENKSLHRQIKADQQQLEEEKRIRQQVEQELEKRTEENSRLKGDLQAKNVQLHQIEADVALLKERMIDMKSRIAEAEKTKEALFYETILSYKRQLDESDKWIASHFADIDTSYQTKKEAEQDSALFERSEHIEAVLQSVTEQVGILQKQLNVIRKNDGMMEQKIDEWKKQSKEENPSQKLIYKIKRKEKETKPLN